MLPKKHFIASTVLAFLAWPFLGFWGLAIYIGGFFVDFDHYLVYLFKERDFSLRNAIKYFYQGPRKSIYIFHTIETIIPLVLLSTHHLFFLSVLLGLSLHMIMDFIGDFQAHQKIKPLSITYYLIKKL